MYSAGARRPLPVRFPPWGVAVLESHHDRDFRMEPVRHPFLKVATVLQGHGAVERPDAAPRRISAGDTVVVPPGTVHAFRDRPGHALSLIVLCVRPDVARAAPRERFRVVPAGARGRETLRLLRRLFVEQSLDRPACGTMMTGLALELLAELSSARPVPGPPVGTPEARVRAYARDLEHRFHEVETIDAAASRLGLGRRTFTRLFRRATGRTWLDRIHELRLRHARTLLLQQDRTVLWIALECGFGDVSTFHRVFRAAEGISPAAWREARTATPRGPKHHDRRGRRREK